MKRVAVALLCILPPTLVWGQSLVELAGKEKERRKKNEAAGVKVRSVTDEELKQGKGQLANDPDAPGMYEPAAAHGRLPSPRISKEAGEESARQADEARWRGRKAQALATLEAATKKHETLSQMWLAPVGEYYADAKGRPAITSVGELQDLTARAKGEMDAARKALDDLEEEARRSGVPPGWLR
jgi:hypothetical protein